MIDFNDMSIRQGIFYAQKLGNRVHCTFILTLFVWLLFFSFFFFFAYRLIQFETLTSTTTPGQSGP